MDIHAIDLAHQRNDEHYEFGKEFGEHVKTSDPKELSIEPLYNEWSTHFSLEDIANKKISKSGITAKIIELDRVRDKTFRGISAMNSAVSTYFEAKVADAAAQLQIVFNSYGNIAGKGMMEKAGAYDNLIAELKSERNSEAMENVGIADWVNELERINSEIFTLNQQRTDEAMERSDIVLKEARAKVDAAYRAICKRIVALEEVFGDGEEGEKYRTFIRRLNIIIDRYNTVVASRKGRTAAGKDTPQQPA